MNQLVKQYGINRDKLDQGQYFQSMFQEVCKNKLLSDTQIERIQLEIVDLMGKTVDRYTSGESSSVRVEKAQELLQSVTYCIGAYLKTVEEIDEVLYLLKNEKLSVLFYKGMDTVSDMKVKSAALLQDIQNNLLKVDNYAYNDTIMKGILIFFHDYNIEYGSHDCPGDIDYPLLETITDLLGVEYLYEYLSRFKIENDFLRHFSNENIGLLLDGFHKESKHMLINLFELVLNNVIGCELVGLDVFSLDIPASDLSLLQSKLVNLNRDQLQNKFENTLNQVGKELGLGKETIYYSSYAIQTLADRVYHNIKTDTLSEVFISFKNRLMEEEPYIDGEPMENEKLRELMNHLDQLVDITDKIDKIKEEVHSLYDLMELLDECFYDSECKQVLELLNETEKAVLRKRILEEAGELNADDYKADREWKKMLFD